MMRANLDGSQIETLVETGRGDADRRDQNRWCVGITIDPVREQIYWTQKGPDNGDRGRIFRAGLEIPKGETAANRSDIEVFFDHLPEPIDLELDLKNRVLYWTDRGDPPRGNTVNRASIDAKPAGAGDRHHASDGRDRHRARCSRRSDVRDRFCRLALFRQARRVGRAQLSLRAGQSHRHRLRGNLKSDQGERTMSNTRPIRRVAIIGTGVIGASWAALFLAKGLEVVATDVAPDAETALRRFVENAWPALERLGLAPGASQSHLSFTPRYAGRSRKRRTSFRKTGPSGSTSRRSSIASSTSCCPPT